MNSQLFERLLISNDVQSVLAVAREEKMPTDPKEIIKDPMVLEFTQTKISVLDKIAQPQQLKIVSNKYLIAL